MGDLEGFQTRLRKRPKRPTSLDKRCGYHYHYQFGWQNSRECGKYNCLFIYLFFHRSVGIAIPPSIVYKMNVQRSKQYHQGSVYSIVPDCDVTTGNLKSGFVVVSKQQFRSTSSSNKGYIYTCSCARGKYMVHTFTNLWSSTVHFWVMDNYIVHIKIQISYIY